MLKKEKLLFVLIGFLLVIVVFSSTQENSTIKYFGSNQSNKNPELSADLEGIENIIVTNAERISNISGYGLLFFEDTLTFKNLNNNPISSVYFGIPVDITENLVFLEAIGIDKNTLKIEKSNMIMKGLEMIIIYFDSPLLPHQTSTITINHIYKDLLSFTIFDDQVITFSVAIYPLLPYRIEDAITYFNYPETASNVEGGWGFVDAGRYRVVFTFDTLKEDLGIDHFSPFLENLEDKISSIIFFAYNDRTKLEMKEINREIFISPWGIIRVKEEFSLGNLGEIDFLTIPFKIPYHANNLYISDDLGEILGVTIEDFGHTKYKLVEINLMDNRVRLGPNTTFNFNVEYNLPFENYVSLNWFQESVQIDLLTTTYDYLGTAQTTKLMIDGCYTVDFVTSSPEAIKKSAGTTILVYTSDFICPTESKVIQFTFTIDIFDILLRPIIFIIVISLITSTFVLIIKTRKKDSDLSGLETKFVPINEIREFCSLYEEKNALILEIRQAEEDSKRKKMAKKKFKNILDKNTSKIDEIQVEINPFKKVLMETSEVFENIVKRLDVLEAERTSVKDSISLLESRYKRGRLPSRAAYIKLSEDFKKRGKKINRTIDKLIQQLRSYLI